MLFGGFDLPGERSISKPSFAFNRDGSGLIFAWLGWFRNDDCAVFMLEGEEEIAMAGSGESIRDCCAFAPEFRLVTVGDCGRC